MNIKNADHIVDVVKDIVLSNYSTEQIPQESIDGLIAYLQEKFRMGEIPDYEALIKHIDEAIEWGWTKSIFYDAK